MSSDFKRGIRIYLETSDYGRGIEAMIAATQKYENQLADLRLESIKMAAAGQNTGKAWDDHRHKMRAVEKELVKSQTAEENYRQKLKQTERVLKNLSGVSYNDLVLVQKQLQRELKDTTRGTDQYVIKLAQLERVNKEVGNAQRDMSSNLGVSASAFDRFSEGVNKYFNVGMALMAGVTALSLTFRKLAMDVAELDDIFSDVMKTTGKTRDEVLLMNEELKKMDTRTSREELNRLAYQAGKLGKESTQDILDFVEAGNQIRVALGEDLGQDAIKDIGKMVGVFESSTRQLQNVGFKEQMLAAGSAINELGASSTANERYLVEFAGRLGGVSKQAKISMADILGYASALDQDMQSVEMSATAFQNFIIKLMGEPAKFADIAGLSVSHFNNLLAKDTNYAIKTVLKALNEKGGFQALIPVFEEMGLDGARAVGVLSSMASSVAKVEVAQQISNRAMFEGVSISNEYNIKNNNLAAQLDKAKNRFHETALELGESLNPMLLKSVKGSTYLIKAMVEIPKWLVKNRELIVTLTVVLAAYALALNRVRVANLAALAVEKLKLFWTNATTAATLLQMAATGYLTGSIRAANVATKAFFATLGLNPFVALAMLIAAATIAVVKWVQANRKASEADVIYNDQLKKQSELRRELSESVTEEKTKLMGLVNAIMLSNANMDVRNKLIDELKEKYPGYLNLLNNERISNDLLKGVLLEINEQYSIRLRNAALQARSSALDDAAVKAEMRRLEIAQEIKSLGAENSKDARNRIEELHKEDRYLQRNINAYKSNALATRTQIELNQEQMRNMNSLGFAQNQLKIWYESAQNFEKLFREARDAGRKDQSAFYQKQLQEANAYVVFYRNKRDELRKLNEQEKAKNKNADNPAFVPPGEEVDPFKEKLAEREKAYKVSQLKLRELFRKQQIDEQELNKSLLLEQFRFLKDKKNIQKQFNQDFVDTELEISDVLLKLQMNSDKELSESLKLSYQAQKDATDAFEMSEKERMFRDFKDKETYEQNLQVLELAVAEKRLSDAKVYSELISNTDFKRNSEKVEFQKAANAEVQKAEEHLLAVEKKIAEEKLQTQQQFEEKRRALIDKYGLSENARMSARYRRDLRELELAKAKELLTLEEFEKAKFKLQTEYAKSYAQDAVDFAGRVANVVAAYHQYETDSLESEKQKQLSIAGDDAVKREQIESDFAQRELDLKKRQSGADAAIKIAQALAAGALGIANIWGVHAANPVMAAILSGIEAAAVGIEVATIIKQRNTILNTTLNASAPSSAADAQATGVRVPQAAAGKYDVIGEEDNFLYRAVPFREDFVTGVVHTPTLIAERGAEIVVDHNTTRNILMNAPWLLSELQRFRVPQRAAGKYDALKDTAMSDTNALALQSVLNANTAVLHEVRNVLSDIRTNGVKAPIVLTELERKIELRNKSLSKGSLG